MSSGTNKLGNNGGRFYAFPSQIAYIDCNFTVDSTNGNGLGVRSLKGAGVKNVFMNTSAAFTGTSHTSILIDGIASGTSSLQVGMPVQGSGIPLGATIAQIVSSGSINLSVATTSSTTGSITYQAIGNPNPAAGYAVIELENNYAQYLGGFSGFVSPLAGSNIAINGTALTVGQPYVIVSAGAASAGTVTIAPVADVSGSLASTWFRLYDAYGNTFIIWFSVSGVGAAPVGVSGTLVQQSILTNATAAQVGAALVLTIENLLAAQPGNITAPAGIDSFTASGTTLVTVVSTQTNPVGPLPGVPMDGLIPTGFTFAKTVYNTNGFCWRGVGLPNGVKPNVGAAFVATTTGVSSGGGSSGLVKVPGVSGIGSIEVVGDANQTLAPVPLGGSPNVGGWILVQFLAPTPTTVDAVPLVQVGPVVPTAPANNSVCGMSFMVAVRDSSVAGE